MKRVFKWAALGLAALGLAAYAAGAWLAAPRPAHPFFVDGRVLVIAHRGGAGLAPEGTLAAFGLADSLGADVLEFDVRLSADGEWVVLHDRSVDRTTDGEGPAAGMSLRQLKALDAGYGWSADGGRTFPHRGRGVEIPTLEETLAAFPGRRFNIEIKTDSVAAVADFCRRLETYGATERVLVASFHPAVIEAARRGCCGAATAATYGEALRFFALNRLGLGAAYVGGADAMQVPVRLGRLAVADARFVEGARRHNIDVHPWTVNDPQTMRTLAEAGVGGIITDYPDRLLQVLGRSPGAAAGGPKGL